MAATFIRRPVAMAVYASADAAETIAAAAVSAAKAIALKIQLEERLVILKIGREPRETTKSFFVGCFFF